jgi:hypothetical protein
MAPQRTERQTGLRATRAAGEVQPCRPLAERAQLIHQLARAERITQHTHATRPADRDLVGPLAAGAERGEDLGNLGLLFLAGGQRRIRRGRHVVDHRAKQPVEQQIALHRRIRLGGQHQVNLEARGACRRRRHPRVI